MAEYTREQLEQMLANLDNDENEEIWIKDGSREYKVTGRRATSILDKLLGEDSDSEDNDETEIDEETPGEALAKARTSQRYFGSKKTA